MPLVSHQYYDEYTPEAPHAPARFPTGSTRARASVDTPRQALGSLLTAATLAPMAAEDTWHTLDLDARTFRRMSPERLGALLLDVSPEISTALFDFLRMVNPGYEARVLRPSGSQAPATQQAALDAMLASIKAMYGSVDVVVNRIILAVFLRGGACAELVLDDAGRGFVDIATPDPGSLSFRQRPDDARGVVWVPGQWQGAEWVALDAPTFRYVPLDSLPGRPDGRAMIAPALFAATFLLALLHDIRRVIQQQGYPRVDISISLEKIAAAMPAGASRTPESFSAWVHAAIKDAQDSYSALEPDDAYIHTDVATVNAPKGTLGADSSGINGVTGIIETIERMLIRGLKTMPLLFGVTEGMSEASSNRLWEIHAARIKSVQHLIESLLEHLFTLALQAQGIPGVVEWRFAELRAAELLRDAQVEELTIRNAREKYRAGWISQDAAAQQGAGVDRADVAEPRDAGSSASTLPIANDSADNGGLR